MSKSDYLENAYLQLIFNGTAIPNIADNAATAPLTELQFGLHESDPGDAGDQETGETNYTGYGRVAVARTGVELSVSGDTMTVVNDIEFPNPTGGSGTITHVVVGTDPTGAGRSLYHGALTPPITITPGTPPKIAAGSTIKED